MEKQYCKVGTIAPIATNTDLVSILEYQYEIFSQKSENSKFEDFFKGKAQKLQKTLQELV